MSSADVALSRAPQRAKPARREHSSSALLRTVFTLGAGRLLAMGNSLLLNMVLGRALGASQYGTWTLVRTFTDIVQTASKLGFENLSLRFVSRARALDELERARALSAGVMAIAALVAVLGCIALVQAAPLVASLVYHRPDIAPYLQTAVAGAFALGVVQILAALLRAWDQARLSTLLVDVGASTLLLAAMAVALGLDPGVQGVSWAYTVAYGLVACLGVLLVFGTLRSSFAFSVVALRWVRERELTNFACFTWLNNVSQIITAQIDRLVLGVFAAPEVLGQYGLGWMLALQVAFPGQIINTALGPTMAALLARDSAGRLSRHLSVVSALGTILAFSALGGLLTVLPVLILVVGKDFAAIESLVAALGMAQVVNVNSGGLGTALNMGGFHRAELAHNWLTSGAAAAVAFALVPAHGAWGAVAAVMSSALLLLALRVRRARLGLGIAPLGRNNAVLCVLGVAMVAAIEAVSRAITAPWAVFGFRAGLVLVFAAAATLSCDRGIRRLLLWRLRRTTRWRLEA